MEGHKSLMPRPAFALNMKKRMDKQAAADTGVRLDIDDIERREINTKRNIMRKKSWGMCEVFLQGNREVLEQKKVILKKPLK